MQRRAEPRDRDKQTDDIFWPTWIQPFLKSVLRSVFPFGVFFFPLELVWVRFLSPVNELINIWDLYPMGMQNNSFRQVRKAHRAFTRGEQPSKWCIGKSFQEEPLGTPNRPGGTNPAHEWQAWGQSSWPYSRGRQNGLNPTLKIKREFLPSSSLSACGSLVLSFFSKVKGYSRKTLKKRNIWTILKMWDILQKQLCQVCCSTFKETKEIW